MYKLLLFIVFAAIAVSVLANVKKSGGEENFKTVGVDEFEKIIADTANIQLVDVRTLAEYEEGHIKTASLIDVKTDSFLFQARENLNVNKAVAVYCRSGKRSAMAADLLSNEGYNVINLDGGIMAWINAGKPVVSM